ncbi:nucleoside deaminase [Microbulbifer epialgicus]|uniref:Nucleoside deaminase n=1 Tax=Microbulbifer epialgicus TaxID=393907 RepID=A0ABV4P6X2_9GAMM
MDKQLFDTQRNHQNIFYRKLSKRTLLTNWLAILTANLLSPNLEAKTVKKETNKEKNTSRNIHEYYMRLAIKEGKNVPKYPFGAVIVNRLTGEIVSKGYNQSTHNPILHGEIVAINNCAKHKIKILWSELDLYSTAEPCPMCQSAIEWAGIKNVYYGSSIPFLQGLKWEQINIRAQEVSDRTPFRNTKIIGGLLEGECNKLFLTA